MKKNNMTPHELLYIKMEGIGFPTHIGSIPVIYTKCDDDCEFKEATLIEDVDISLIESLHCHTCFKDTCNRCVIRTLLDDIRPQGLLNEEYLCDNCYKQADLDLPDLTTEERIMIINKIIGRKVKPIEYDYEEVEQCSFIDVL